MVRTYRNSLKYWVVRALPLKTNRDSDIDLMAQRITIYTNLQTQRVIFSRCFFTGIDHDVWCIIQPVQKNHTLNAKGGLDRALNGKCGLEFRMLILLPILAVVAINMGMKYKMMISPN